MLQLLERDRHTRRLQNLLTRFRNQERLINDRLTDLQDQLEAWHREASYLQLHDGELGGAPATLRRCSELQQECDELANELVHVRMAITGAADELCHQGDQPFDGYDQLLRA